jgi:peptide deformylase
MIKPILLLGDPRLYEKSAAVRREEMAVIRYAADDLHDTLMDFRKKHGAGRAIAAPQIGVFKRLIYMHIDKPVVLINPVLRFEDGETMEVLDDCMSFPELLVRVRRYRRCAVEFKDMDFSDNRMVLEGDLSELLQHEADHLDGILATMRAVDDKSLCLKSQKPKFLEALRDIT